MSGRTLEGRVALVTGATRRIGIGAAIARELARAGAAVFVHYFRPVDRARWKQIDESDPETLLAELRRLGTKAEGAELDLADADAPARLVAEVHERLGGLDVLVNNAAYWEGRGWESVDAGNLDRHYAVNLRAMTLLCAELARHRPPGPGGRIVNLSSGQGQGPMPGELAYVATKGAVDALTVSLAAELGPRGITVNAVDPGATDTGWMTPELRTRFEADSPFGRLGTPEDTARLVAFLASEDAAWITGQILRSRGGV